MKKIHDYIGDRNRNKVMDVDFHDIVELNEMGLNKEEIAKELGISSDEAKKLIDELERNF